MTKSYFVDTNIFIYASGKDHAYKVPSVGFLEKMAKGKIEVMISSEVLQEILYRFCVIKARKDGLVLCQKVVSLCPVIFPVTREDAVLAAKLMEQNDKLGPRDAIHCAVMKNNNISTIVSYDRDMDGLSGIKRVSPEMLLSF